MLSDWNSTFWVRFFASGFLVFVGNVKSRPLAAAGFEGYFQFHGAKLSLFTRAAGSGMMHAQKLSPCRT